MIIAYFLFIVFAVLSAMFLYEGLRTKFTDGRDISFFLTFAFIATFPAQYIWG